MLGIRLLFALVIAVVAASFASLAFGLVCGSIAVAIAVSYWFIGRTYRFTVSDDVVRTEMLFTKDVDVTTPIANIQSISAHEGVFEAICSVGTVEISTASSNLDHATFRWPALANHREIVELLRAQMTTHRRG